MNFSLRQLILSDINKYFEYTSRPNKKANNFSMVRAFITPRILPVTIYRVSHFFYRKKLSPISKIFGWINFYINGCEITGSCSIGPGLFFPHCNGIVIGARSIGANAVIYHNVTIGAKFIEYEHINRPIIGDNCFFGANSIVLGKIIVGDNCKIGAGQLITESITSNSKIV